MKTTLFVLLFFMCAIISGAAQGADRVIEYKQYLIEQRSSEGFMTFDNPSWTREDMLVRKAVQGKWYSISTNQPTLLSSSKTSIQTIDGPEPAIEISQVRTGLPEEYMTLPPSKKDMERYTGK